MLMFVCEFLIHGIFVDADVFCQFKYLNITLCIQVMLN